VALRRDDPSVKYDDVLDLPIADLPKMSGGNAPKSLRAVEPVAQTS
jgi:hypothetical protein